MENYTYYNNNEQPKTKKDRLMNGILIASGVISVIGLSIAFAGRIQVKRVAKLVDSASSTLSDKTVVDVERSLINKAVDKAVDRNVGAAVRRAVDDVERDIFKETSRQVTEAVIKSKSKIDKAVGEKIAKEVMKIDHSDILESATDEVKELMIEEFRDKLDDVVAAYQKNIENIGKIYQSIATSMGNVAKPGEIKFDI